MEQYQRLIDDHEDNWIETMTANKKLLIGLSSSAYL